MTHSKSAKDGQLFSDARYGVNAHLFLYRPIHQMSPSYCAISLASYLLTFTYFCCYVIKYLHCALSLASQCIVIGPVCGGRAGVVCLWVCFYDNSKLRNIDLHQTGSVGPGSDHLQLIKFWPSRAPGKGVCGGAKVFGSALLQWRFSVAVTRWSRPTQLLYIEPG